MRPVYRPEVSLGNLLAIASMLATLGVMELPRSSDVKVMQKDVARHEEMLKELTTSQHLIAANLQVLTAIVNNHIGKAEVPH